MSLSFIGNELPGFGKGHLFVPIFKKQKIFLDKIIEPARDQNRLWGPPRPNFE